MAQLKVPTNRINYIMQKLQLHCDEQTLQNGWDLHYRNAVMNLRLVDGLTLRADLRSQQKRLYEVSIPLDDFNKSTCTCNQTYCQHVVAIFFTLYAAHNRPELVFRQLYTAILSRDQASRAARARERTEKKRQATATLQPKDMPKEWHALFEQRFHGYTLSNQQAIESFYDLTVNSLMPMAAQWDQPLQRLYELHVILFILRKMDQFHTINQESYLSFYHETSCRKVALTCWKHIDRLAPSFHAASIALHYPTHWKQTLTYIRNITLKPDQGPVEWLNLYRHLWTDILAHEPNMYAQEQKKLDIAMQKTMPGTRARDIYILASVHFDVLLQADDMALKKLEGLHAKELHDFFVILHHCQKEQAWERVLVWLRWLLPLLTKAKKEDFHEICAVWQQAMAHQASDHEWIQVMRTLLPRSYYYYSDYLMRTSRYRQWIDLQLSTGVSPADLQPEHLKAVEQMDPSSLLPLYHQAIERLIEEKHRTSYQIAVKMLKKLQSCYAKINQTHRWESYITQLSNRYIRLRAFQQELNKGGWLS